MRGAPTLIARCRARTTALWCTLFVEYWKRQEARLSQTWCANGCIRRIRELVAQSQLKNWTDWRRGCECAAQEEDLLLHFKGGVEINLWGTFKPKPKPSMLSGVGRYGVTVLTMALLVCALLVANCAALFVGAAGVMVVHECGEEGSERHAAVQAACAAHSDINSAHHDEEHLFGAWSNVSVSVANWLAHYKLGLGRPLPDSSLANSTSMFDPISLTGHHTIGCGVCGFLPTHYRTFSSMFILVFIIVFGMIYERIAKKLTFIENHMFRSQAEQSLVIKGFLFQFINYVRRPYTPSILCKSQFNAVPCLKISRQCSSLLHMHLKARATCLHFTCSTQHSSTSVLQSMVFFLARTSRTNAHSTLAATQTVCSSWCDFRLQLSLLHHQLLLSFLKL
eukprot:SAG11_NODE_806_length_7093_cov_1.965379_7_plen_394_part_00